MEFEVNSAYIQLIWNLRDTGQIEEAENLLITSSTFELNEHTKTMALGIYADLVESRYGEKQRADFVFEQVLSRIHDLNCGVLIALALLLCKSLRNHDRAIQCFMKGLEYAGVRAFANDCLAQLYEHVFADYDLALQYYMKVMND
jgi:hypothetical protein